jgi:hypothetical protein
MELHAPDHGKFVLRRAAFSSLSELVSACCIMPHRCVSVYCASRPRSIR